ncbi:MAG: hypothetical protein KAU83_11860, partial [Bacteroidales bacterium]|nr:hypothetical protein [Bacteroidales bacterium]
MTVNRLTYNELEAKYKDIQIKVTRFLKVKQELNISRDNLDRELARFKGIQSYNEKVILVSNLEKFAETTVESIIEAFELACSAILTYNKSTNILSVLAASGFEHFIDHEQLSMDWIVDQGHLKGGPFIEQIDLDTHPWKSLGIYQMICSPYYGQNGEFRGLVFGGISLNKKSYYDEIKEELIPSFTVFTQQMSAMLHNFESKEYLERTVRERTTEVVKQKDEIESQRDELEQTLENLKQTQSQLIESK